MAYDPLGTVSSGGTATKVWADKVHQDLEAVKPRHISLYPHGGGGSYVEAASYGNHRAVRIGTSALDGSALFDDFLVPSDLVIVSSAKLRCASLETGVVRYQLSSVLDSVGGALNSGSSTVILPSAVDLSVTTAILFEIDISALLAGITGGMAVGMGINRIGSHANDTITNFYVFGAFILYTP